MPPRYRRILLKLSGEALMGGRGNAIDPETIARIADEIVEVHRTGVQIAIVIGGGNIFRGVTAATEGIDRVAGDHMGMLATVINAIAMQDALERRGAQTRVAAAIDLARGSSIPIYIFSLMEPGNLRCALLGEDIGSIVSD